MADLFCDGLNIAKFVLSIVSIVFDLIFMFQHYILYNPKKKKNVDDEVENDPEDIMSNLMKFNNGSGQTQA